jgi:hypothetical protein
VKRLLGFDPLQRATEFICRLMQCGACVGAQRPDYRWRLGLVCVGAQRPDVLEAGACVRGCPEGPQRSERRLVWASSRLIWGGFRPAPDRPRPDPSLFAHLLVVKPLVRHTGRREIKKTSGSTQTPVTYDPYYYTA